MSFIIIIIILLQITRPFYKTGLKVHNTIIFFWKPFIRSQFLRVFTVSFNSLKKRKERILILKISGKY